MYPFWLTLTPKIGCNSHFPTPPPHIIFTLHLVGPTFGVCELGNLRASWFTAGFFPAAACSSQLFSQQLHVLASRTIHRPYKFWYERDTCDIIS